MKILYICLLLSGFLAGCGEKKGSGDGGASASNPDPISSSSSPARLPSAWGGDFSVMSSSPRGVFFEKETLSEAEQFLDIKSECLGSGPMKIDSRLQTDQVFKIEYGSLSDLRNRDRFLTEVTGTVLAVDQQKGEAIYHLEYLGPNGQENLERMRCVAEDNRCYGSQTYNNYFMSGFIHNKEFCSKTSDVPESHEGAPHVRRDQGKSYHGIYQFPDGTIVNAYKSEYVYTGYIICYKEEDNRWVETRHAVGTFTTVTIVSSDIIDILRLTCNEQTMFFRFDQVEMETGELAAFEKYEVLSVPSIIKE